MIKIEFSGNKIKELTKGLKSRVRDLRPPLTGYGNYLKEETEKQFQNETTPSGSKWAALKPSTLAQKRRQGYPDSILTRTGKMRRSTRYTVDQRSLTFSLDSPYAIFHQYGTKRMASRKILGVTKPRREKLKRLVTTYLRGKAR